eukprot:g3096.t1
MLKNFIKDCLACLVLEFVILTGFSFSLFIMFQYVLQNREPNGIRNDDEIRPIVERSFGDPWKAMLTLICAMFGFFNPKIYHRSGALSPVITTVFVLYMGTQLVMVLSMFIVFMGEAYDNNDDDEDNLWIGRQTLNAYERELTRKRVKMVKDCIRKEFSILRSRRGDVRYQMKQWHQRTRTTQDVLEN